MIPHIPNEDLVQTARAFLAILKVLSEEVNKLPDGDPVQLAWHNVDWDEFHRFQALVSAIAGGYEP